MIFSSRERAPPAHSNQPTAWSEAPPAAGPRPSPPLGGEGASIAQMYILRACRGNPPVPYAACGRKIGGRAAERSVECEVSPQ